MRSADQRAAILAAVAPLAATLALAGVAVIIDADKWKDQATLRHWFGVLLVAALILLTVAALFAVGGHRTPQHVYTWKGWDKKKLPPWNFESSELNLEDQSKAKHAKVHLSMQFLVAGMVAVVVLTLLAVIADIARP
jgi:hypothetical protein